MLTCTEIVDVVPNIGEAVRELSGAARPTLDKRTEESGQLSSQGEVGRKARAQGRHGSLTSAHLRAAGGYRTRWLPVAPSLEDMWGQFGSVGAEAKCCVHGRHFHSLRNQGGLDTENEFTHLLKAQQSVEA